MMTAQEIRDQFLDFFRSKQHKIVPSAPIVNKDDPTLMFTNAGMNQFKDLFLGNQVPDARRIADTQKCLRVSGKHNDLEEVGLDGTHHTMFEMLGNWSIGDYFKEEAIAWSWEFLTERLGLDASRIYATVFEGDQKENLASDEESRAFWKQFLPDNRIINGNKKNIGSIIALSTDLLWLNKNTKTNKQRDNRLRKHTQNSKKSSKSKKLQLPRLTASDTSQSICLIISNKFLLIRIPF